MLVPEPQRPAVIDIIHASCQLVGKVKGSSTCNLYISVHLTLNFIMYLALKLSSTFK